MKLSHLLLASCFFMGSGLLVAQDTRVSLGLEAALPMGDFSDFYGFGIGGSLGFELPVGPVGVMAQAGYISFSGQTSGGFSLPALAVIPIQVGGKYYFIDNQMGPYLGALVGVHMTNCEGCEARTNLSYAPVLGFMITERFDLGLRYQFMTDRRTVPAGTITVTESVTNSYLGLRAAFGF